MLDLGLVLEGGGLRGNYTAGVLDAFLDGQIFFPYVIGVSAGAGMGCSYVSGQRGRNLEILRRFHGDPRYLSFRNFIRTGSLFGMDFVFHRIPKSLIPLDWKHFVNSPVRFTTVCTDCETGRAEYFEKPPETGSEDFLTILEASSSMPYAAPMVAYHGKKYLDGAIADAIPLKKALSDGFARNVVVLTNPAGYRKKQEPHPPDGLFYFGRKELIGALKTRVERYNRTLEWVEAEEKAGGLFVIRPSKDLHVSRIEKSKTKLEQLYELGYTDAKTAVLSLGHFADAPVPDHGPRSAAK
ncbi:MAG: patatin family protein [Spirochaetaceae bacterium]|jgi:predicted patatin/cPLA2 family phospholipase|nr:patatin family protein [Spirochaetaceae bacterium]